uniref:Uncharacterized protein n=1 Tax=Pseudomonas phage HRDY3 TaxID=3236930 RepID=A0AB39CDZ2_9VIRU
MSVTDKFNYWDLPRDGRTQFLYDDEYSLASFLAMAEDAAYILIPGCYSEIIAKWATEDAAFQLAPMSLENMQGGFIGTCNSVEMFTDAFAGKDRRYPAGAPCVFGQWGGKFTVELETERSPYYRLRNEPDNGMDQEWREWDRDAFWTAPRYGKGVFMEVVGILLPRRFVPDFYADPELMARFARRATGTVSTVEENFNGWLGDYCGIPVYTDDYLHRAMVDNSDPIVWKVKQT